VSAFEIDLFGRLASATAAERQRALATEAAARTVRLALVSDLANAWSLHAADAELLRIAEDTAANASRSVTLNRARLEGGVAPRTELRQAEQILATAQGDVAAQKTALAQDRNLIQLLVGAPFDAALLPARLDEVLVSVATLPAGTSSEVLLRRPDVVEAEYQLRAANAEIGVARAQLFPRISLTGLLGFASDTLGSLVDSAAFHTTLGADASYAIFSGGGARANVVVSQAQRDAALATYEKAIQTAFREVADALARQGTIADELRATALNVMAATDTARLTEARYRGGVASSLDNLDAQRSAYSAQRAEVSTRLAAVQNRVSLYRALGGDQASAR
jgi:multidrug efflux system outer membrane protein